MPSGRSAWQGAFFQNVAYSASLLSRNGSWSAVRFDVPELTDAGRAGSGANNLDGQNEVLEKD